MAIARAELLDVGSATKLTPDLALVGVNKYLAQLVDALILWNAKEILGAWAEVAFVAGDNAYDISEGALTPEFKCPIMARKDLGFVYINSCPLPVLTDHQYKLYAQAEADGATVPQGWIIRHNAAGAKKLIILPAPDATFIADYANFELNYFRDYVPRLDLDETMPCDDRFRYDASEYLKLFVQLILRKVSNVDVVMANWVRSKTFNIVSMDRPSIEIDYDSEFLNTCNWNI